MKHRRAKHFQVCKDCGELANRAHKDGCTKPGYRWVYVPPYGND